MRRTPAALAALLAGCGGTTAAPPVVLGGATAVSPVVPAGPRLPIGVVLRARTDTYRVVGGDLASVTASLRAGGVVRGQRRFAGSHHWHLTWRFRSRFESTQCAISAVTVTIESQILLPAWTAPPAASPELRAQWTTYLAALSTHEEGHRVMATAGAVRLREALLQVRAARCEGIGPTARAEADRYLALMRDDGQRYDLETRHGATQGASWPPSPPRAPRP